MWPKPRKTGSDSRATVADSTLSTHGGTASERTSLLSAINNIVLEQSPAKKGSKYGTSATGTLSSELLSSDTNHLEEMCPLSRNQLLSDPKVVAQTCCGYLKKAGFGGWMQTRYFAIVPGKSPKEHWQLAWWESLERYRAGVPPRNSVSVMTIDSIQPAIQPSEFSIHFKDFDNGDGQKEVAHKSVVLSANCTDSRPRDVWMDALQYFLITYKKARQQRLWLQHRSRTSGNESDATSVISRSPGAANVPDSSPAPAYPFFFFYELFCKISLQYCNNVCH